MTRNTSLSAGITALAALFSLALLGAGGTQQRPPAAPKPLAPAATPAVSQPSEVMLTLSGESGRRIPIAIPPPIAPITPELQVQVADPFRSALTEDLGGSPYFIVTDPSLYPKGARPPAAREDADGWIAGGAQFLLDTAIQPVSEGEGGAVVVAHLYDLKTLRPILSKRYKGEARSARRIAHYLANDIVRQFTGKPGPFMTSIAFVSDRDGPGKMKEIYLMDFDGESQRRVSYHQSLSLAPDWSWDGSKIVYQSYWKGSPGIFMVAKDGGEKRNVPVTTSLNASPSFSPDGRIAYCGSVKGNPEIFTVAQDGGSPSRLTNSAAIDSTPRWAPNGREMAFTSNRQGSPQLYVMDAEGANIRRMTFAGNWNDEASFSPDGQKLAYACRNEGDMQICVQDLVSGRVLQVSTGTGAHENPTWSPDGTKLAWEVQRGNSTQIVVANTDGSSVKAVTSIGNNFSPSWSKTLE